MVLLLLRRPLAQPVVVMPRGAARGLSDAGARRATQQQVARRIVSCRRDDTAGVSTDCTTALTAHSPEQMPELHPALRAAA